MSVNPRQITSIVYNADQDRFTFWFEGSGEPRHKDEFRPNSPTYRALDLIEFSVRTSVAALALVGQEQTQTELSSSLASGRAPESFDVDPNALVEQPAAEPEDTGTDFMAEVESFLGNMGSAR